MSSCADLGPLGATLAARNLYARTLGSPFSHHRLDVVHRKAGLGSARARLQASQKRRFARMLSSHVSALQSLRFNGPRRSAEQVVRKAVIVGSLSLWRTTQADGIGQEKSTVRNETRLAFESSPKRTPDAAAIGQSAACSCRVSGPPFRAEPHLPFTEQGSTLPLSWRFKRPLSLASHLFEVEFLLLSLLLFFSTVIIFTITGVKEHQLGL